MQIKNTRKASKNTQYLSIKLQYLRYIIKNQAKNSPKNQNNRKTSFFKIIDII